MVHLLDQRQIDLLQFFVFVGDADNDNATAVRPRGRKTSSELTLTAI